MVSETYNLPYDKNSALSIFEYSKGILGKSLRDFLTDDYELKEGKGRVGQMVENLYFMLATNSNPEADFSNAGMELKSTPLKLGKDDTLLIKERLVCNMIAYCDVVNEDFEHSHFYTKCRLMLLLFYLHKKGVEYLDFEFIFSVLWKLPEKDLIVIKQDYETIINKIKSGSAHLLSEGDTMYLGACRKGQKGDSLMKQPYNSIGAPRRAFSLKPAYMRTILNYVLDSGEKAVSNFEIQIEQAKDVQNQLVSTSDLKEHTFDEILLQRITPYIGRDYVDIAQEKNIDLSKNPKNKFSIIANTLISNGQCFNVNRSEEFLKAGLTMKTIRVQKNGNIKEAMSFENIDYIEIAECDNWFDSRLYELFTGRFMFVIFREQPQGKENYCLDQVFFWTMPQGDLEVAEEYWQHIRNNVLASKIGAQYWWKGSDRRKFHVRPKAQKSTDLSPAPNGTFAKKYCYWFNNDYVKQLVTNNATK